MAEIQMENDDEELSRVLEVLGAALDAQGLNTASLLGRRWDGEASEVQIHLQDESWEMQSRAIDAVVEGRNILFDEEICFAYSLGTYWPVWDD